MTELEVVVEHPGWAALGDAESFARRALAAAFSVAPDAPHADVAIGLLLTDDASVRVLNRDFRGKDEATNVLSFPAADQPAVPGAKPLGDIALAYETVAREAEAEGKSLADHAAHLIVHGTLHLLGYDHGLEAQAEIMENLEVRALAALGVADPYADRAA